ncbi:MAG: J domain-containing protein [Nanoarchaeota archaeon]|nr:J domain-containing protein [Nanoarchaeota archaeon]
MVEIKGQEFEQVSITNSYNRRALQYKNKIIEYLKSFKLTEDDVKIPLEKMGMKKAQASVAWYFMERHLFFSYNGSGKFVENLAMAEQVIRHFMEMIIEKEITVDEFINLFAEDRDILKQRKHARTVLGMDEESTDFETMHQNFKKLAKKHHPDMPGGSTEKFKEVNSAHKILRKELS